MYKPKMIPAFTLALLAIGQLCFSATAAQEAQADGKIKFTFDQMEWKPIIEWFADEAGLSLQPIDQPPPGTFIYRDDRDYTIAEAMDVLNHALIMRGHILIRNNQMLVLVDINEGIPKGLIETVGPEQLDKRGFYEVLRCRFDISGLPAEGLREEIEPLVSDEHRASLALVPTANQMIVQETGGNLRTIRSMIETAKKSIGLGTFDISVVELQHVSPEEVMAVARPHLKIPDNGFRTPDDSLNISIDPFGAKIYFSGSPQAVAQLKRIIDTVDVETAGPGTALEVPYIKVYPAGGIADSELVFKVLQTMLEGRPDINIDRDTNTGNIIARARTGDHEVIQETIQKIENTTDTFAVIDTRDPDELMSTLQTLFRQSDDDTSAAGPIFYADTYNDRLIVRGTPQEVAFVQRMVEQLDAASVLAGGSRDSTRIIEVDADRALDVIEQLWPTLGRENIVDVVMPDERTFRYNRRRSMFQEFGLENRQQDPPTQPTQPPQLPKTDAGEKGGFSSSFPPSGSSSGHSLIAFAGLGCWPLSGQDEARPQDEGDDEVQQKTEIQSVPGAPITVQVTDYGLIISSQDLDALDDLELLIRDRLTGEPQPDRPTFFFLKHRDAQVAKQLLEEYLGISSSGGGGGSALGNLMGGAISNALGPAGEMFGGLFGDSGGGDTTAGVIETEGPVSIIADIKLQSLLVTATPRDMEVVRQLIEYIDQEEAPQSPNNIGVSRTIPIRYREPAEIEQIVRQQLSDVIKSNDAGSQLNAQAAQMQQQQQFLQALLRGGRGGRGGGQSNVEEEKPKASLSVDLANRALVVTGPQYIYDQIYELVQHIDQPGFAANDAISVVRIPGMKADLLGRSLQAAMPDKIELTGGTSTGSPAPGSNGRTTTAPTATPSGLADPNLQQMIQDRMRALQQFQQQQPGGGRRGGGFGRGGDAGGGGEQGGGPPGARNRGGRGGG